MQYLRLSDGTELQNSYVALSGNNLFFYIQCGLNMTEVFALMNDPEKTNVIQYIGGEDVIEYREYTILKSIELGGVDGLITGVLTR